MHDEQFEKRLAGFKENENPEAVLLIADDPDRMKVLVAWSSVNLRHGPVPREGGPISTDDWEALWESTEYSDQEIAAKSGLPITTVRAHLTLLIGNRVLYPDGTINSFVQRYLRQRVLTLSEKRSTQGRKSASRNG